MLFNGMKEEAGLTKILYVIGTLDIGGAERHLTEVVKRLDRDRFQPYICALSEGGALQAEVEAAGVPVIVIGFRGFSFGLRRLFQKGAVRTSPFKIFGMLRKMYRFMKEEKFDIVHGYLFWAYIIGTLVARAAKVPVVIASRRSLGHFKAKKIHYLFIERIVNRKTDLIIANSEAVKADVIRQEKVSPGKIIVIHNGIEAAPYEKPVDTAAKRKELGIPPNASLIGVIANLIHYKGHKYLIEAAATVQKVVPDARFLLIGEGPMRQTIETQIEELGLAENFILAGTRRDVVELLAAMDISVLPSLEEGFSNTILESMAAGRPVVATAVGGNPEAVVDGVTGFLVPPRSSEALAQAILGLLGDREKAGSMGRAARERVRQEFTMGKMVGEMEAVYDKILDEKRSIKCD